MQQSPGATAVNRPLETGALVSLIVVAAPTLRGAASAIADAVAFIAERYAFYEVLLITTDFDDSADSILEVVGRSVPHLRLLQIEGGTDFDELAIHGYQQAIGDTVVLSSSDELPHVDLELLFAPIRDGAQFVRLRRKRGSFLAMGAASVVRALTGFEVDTRYYRTLALVRQIMSELLASPDQLHLVRFTAGRFIRKQKTVEVELPPVRSSYRRLIARSELVLHLIATSSVRLLRLATAFCTLLSLGAFVAMLYPIVLWIIGWDVTEGWSSTIIMISAWACVQLAATAVICLGMSRVLERQEVHVAHRVAGDRSVGDLFGRSDLLNVETATSPSDSDPKAG